MFILSFHKLRSSSSKYVRPTRFSSLGVVRFKSCPFTLSGHLSSVCRPLDASPPFRSRLNWTNKQITDKFDFVTRARNSWSIFSYGNWIFSRFYSPFVLNPKSQLSCCREGWMGGKIMDNLSEIPFRRLPSAGIRVAFLLSAAAAGGEINQKLNRY